MNKKNGIILGAGTMQAPAIRAAKELGFFVTALDANPAAPAAALADRFEKIDIKDAAAVRDFALKTKAAEGLSLVFTAGTDFSVSAALACEACGLPSHSVEAARNASDKVRMRRAFEEAGVPSPAFAEIDCPSKTLPPLPPGLDFPLVIKPVDNMGARGCRMVRDKREYAPALKAAAENSRARRVILEEYMEGPEFSIDALVHKGTLTICGFADRHIFFPPYFVETGHTMPTRFDKPTVLSLIRAFAQGAAALGLSCGAAKGDVKLTPQGPMIGEIAARLSGGYMSGWTYPYASGFDLTSEALRIAAGLPPEALEKARVPLEAAGAPFRLYDVPAAKVCAERAWISIPGAVTEITGVEEARAKAVCVFERASPGGEVSFPRNNVEKCGNVIALADTWDEAVRGAESAAAGIVLRLRPWNGQTGVFIRGDQKEGEAGFPPPAFPVPREILEALENAPPVPRDSPVSPALPECLKPFRDQVDWNYRTLSGTLALFDALSPKHHSLPGPAFWRACVQGGIQGALYIADTVV